MIGGVCRAVYLNAVRNERRTVGNGVFEYQIGLCYVSRIGYRDRIVQRIAFYGKRFIYLFHDADGIGKNVKRDGFGLLGVGYVAPYGVVYGVLQGRKMR